MTKIIKYLKSTIIGLAMMLYSCYEFYVSDASTIKFTSFQGMFLSFCFVIGFILLFTGDKHINRLIDLLIVWIKNKTTND